jgi:predicted CXXCH cytochrome family protein
MARTRTQKAVSRRIDLSYFKRAHPLRTGRKAFVWLTGLVTILFLAFYSANGDARLHNPGHLTAHHASFENDCAKCHDNGGQGGLSKTVADVSCLQCHAGALHHPNQLASTVQVFKGHEMAKDCVSCHTEHRGQDLLVNASDTLCITCHGNLPANAKVPPQHPENVVAFNVAQHPNFGRDLRKDGKLTDPTVLKFNHAVHNKQAVLANNCTACHSTVPLPASEPLASNAPPYKTDKDTLVSRDASRAGMLPISYERNCIGCHALTLPGKVTLTLPHESLASLRPYIGGLGSAYLAALNAMPDKSKELVTEVRTGRPPRQKVEKVVITEQQWVEARLKDLYDAADKSFGSNATYAAIKKAAPTSRPLGMPDVATTEHFVTFGMGTACNYCHTIGGTLTPATSPAQLATRNGQLPYTVPTGIPTTPRKWYTKAKFDHDAHRGVACLDCHAGALTEIGPDQSAFGIPDIDTTINGVSCIGCHKADTSTFTVGLIRGAPSNCITCHDFHDRSREPPGPSSRPVETAAK